MENKAIKFGYEDTDKEVLIDLYGIIFKVNNIEEIDKLKDIDKENVNEIEETIKKLLGEDAIDKINNKRITDGKNAMDVKIELAVLGCIFQAYTKVMAESVIGKVENSINNINERINNFGNRQEKRYNRRYNKYRR